MPSLTMVASFVCCMHRCDSPNRQCSDPSISHNLCRANSCNICAGHGAQARSSEAASGLIHQQPCPVHPMHVVGGRLSAQHLHRPSVMSATVKQACHAS